MDSLYIVQTLCERSPVVAPMAVVVSVTKVTDNCLPNGGSSIVLIGDTNMIILGWRSTAATQACSPQHPAPSPLVLLTLISSHIMCHHSHPPVHVFWLLHALLLMNSKLLSLCIFHVHSSTSFPIGTNMTYTDLLASPALSPRVL